MMEVHLCYQLLLFLGLFSIGESNKLPIFNHEKIVITIDEELPIGAFIRKVQATDPENFSVHYALNEDDANKDYQYFKIDESSGNITIAKRIDFDSFVSQYPRLIFKVAAFTKDAPDLKAYQTVKITLRNINDNVPRFTKERYVENIKEDIGRESYVGNVSAEDKDKNSELLYKIISGNERGCFTINMYSGIIRTKKKLDYETKRQYVLGIMVEDAHPSDENRHNATTTFTITLIDVDDNGPRFETNYTKVIKERYYKDEFICKVLAFDQDRSIKNPIKYSIDPVTNEDGYFTIDDDGFIYANGNIDREKNPEFNLTLIAEEKSNKRQPKAEAYFKIKVLDVNDNRPKFLKDSYLFDVKEHGCYGCKIGAVEAEDPDDGENARFQYLINDTTKTFDINRNGDVIVMKELDRERVAYYEFLVYAVEGDMVASHTKVTVIVKDENDHGPKFEMKEYRTAVKENMPPNTYVTTVSANDQDADGNNLIKYSIATDAYGDYKHFRIDEKFGKIFTTGPIDRETVPSISLIIRAVDGGNGVYQRSNETTVKIDILDENDSKPEFVKLNYYKTLRYDVQQGTPVVTVTATDNDSGNYAKVFYDIIDGNSDRKFELDEESGQLRVANTLADSATGEYYIYIRAYDNYGESPSQQSLKNALVSIKIDKSGDNSVKVILALILNAQNDGDDLKRDLENFLNIGIVFDNRENDLQDGITTIIFHGYDRKSRTVVKKSTILDAFESSTGSDFTKIKNKWNITSWYPVDTQSSNIRATETDQWLPILYAVLGFTGLVVLFGLIGMCYLMKTKRRNINDGMSSSVATSSKMLESRKTESVWLDDGFESVSQVGGRNESYLHASGFLNHPTDKYELDPSNLFTKTETYSEDDPFTQEFRSPSPSRASSIFASSSITTIYKSPKSKPLLSKKDKQNKNYLYHKNSLNRNNPNLSSKGRKLSVILDADGRPTSFIESDDELGGKLINRPPSFDYDLDAKI